MQVISRFDRFAVPVVLGLLALCQPCLAAEPIDFDRQIRPILSENCFHCHGPDAGSRAADLRLDTREGAIDSGAIVAGSSADSELVRRIRSTDHDEQMPPPGSNRKLTSEQIELLTRWIDDGAEWSVHWAFVPPVRRMPQLDQGSSAYPGNPIDAFILQRLESEGLAPSPEADRGRLLRRVTLDLTGLPPSIAEQDAFLADERPGAYERLVDRLLASPRYGERMVWDWLDAARYADTNGYQGDPTRSMWYWRDWAIRALNANQPFDEFSIEQLAGDLLPNPSRDQLVATGFHRNHMINGEGGRIAEESRVDYVQDRTETTGTVWLGLTFNCCRCHDHKFDSLSQREYYQLAAYFNSIDETGAGPRGLVDPTISLASPSQSDRLEELRVAERDASQKLSDVEKLAAAQQSAWEASLLESGLQRTGSPDVAWQQLVPTSLTARQGSELQADASGVVTVSGPNPNQEMFSLLFAPPAGKITALKLAALPDQALPGGGPGRAGNGNFVLSHVAVEVYGRALELESVQADVAQNGHPASLAIDGNPQTGWAILPHFSKPHELRIVLKAPMEVPAGEVLTVRLQFESPHAQHVLGKFAISSTTAPLDVVRGLPEAVAAALEKVPDARSAAEQQALQDYFRENHAEIKQARTAADQTKSRREGYERSLPRTMVMRELAQPRDTRILIRGAYNQYGDPVTHGTPAILPPLPDDAPANRLALARWLMSSQHPLTARVVVNRIWQSLFGTGLVKTVDDFGVQGEKPTHPDLLDWLAVELIESGWDVKHIQRLIVTSATYRQTSRVTQAAVERDPENRLLARGPRYRWPSWIIRDQALAASGLLEETIGGPPVKGYQPAGIWEEATFGKIRYEQDHGTALYRRSLYQFWRRIVGPTVFFDVSSRQTCTVAVARTNTPLQALVTLNDVTYQEAARKLAERICREGGATTGDRLDFAWRTVLSRLPTAQERELLSSRIGKLTELYQADVAAAAEVVQAGESAVDTTIPTPDMAVWTTISATLLNLDEALSKE